MNSYATIPLNQPNREELIRVLEHIRETEPETFERNVRECAEKIPAPTFPDDCTGGQYWYSFYPHFIKVFSGDVYAGPIAIFRIKTRKP